MKSSESKLTLFGFNNLTKSLSFSLYDINYAKSEYLQEKYKNYIDEQYSADRLTSILKKVCTIIGANVLNIAQQNYQPQGASVTMLVSEEALADSIHFDNSAQPGPLPESVVSHLDKSHICVHTYPESHPDNGITTFRADIEVSTCGVISPLRALNYLIHCFDSDIVLLDYRVRGFTRDINGEKHFIDHKIDSIQNFLDGQTRNIYQMHDVNMFQENIFHTKMLKKSFNLSDYILSSNVDDFSQEEQRSLTIKLQQEMQEIYYGANLTKF